MNLSAPEPLKGAEILLIQPPIRDFYLTMKRTIPYGLTAIAAPLIEAGFRVALIDMLATSKSRPIDLPPEMAYLVPFFGNPDISPFSLFHQFRRFGYSHHHLKNELKRHSPFLIGVSSLFTAYSDEALTVARIAKELHPQAALVMGGHHPTALAKETISHDFVDYVIRGEGEEALLRLALAIQNKERIGAVPGIVFKKENGAIYLSEPALTEALDALPLPASHLIKTSYYRRGPGSAITLMTGRGCPMTCSYCSMGELFRRYRKRSVPHVMAELTREISIRNARFIDFEDENLSLDRRWFIHLLEEIIIHFGERQIELRAMNGLFPPSLDETLIALMKQAGFKTLNLAIGSTDPDQLRRFKRPDVREAVERVLTICDDLLMETVCYVIAGGPGQSADSSLKDLLYLHGKNAIAGLSVFYPAPGSLDYSVLETRGQLPPSFSLMRATALPIAETTTRIETATLLRISRIINFMKALKKSGEPVPGPRPLEAMAIPSGTSRMEIGKILLAAFLHDGQIRGVTPDGSIYEHGVSARLTRGFIDGI